MALDDRHDETTGPNAAAPENADTREGATAQKGASVQKGADAQNGGAVQNGASAQKGAGEPEGAGALNGASARKEAGARNGAGAREGAWAAEGAEVRGRGGGVEEGVAAAEGAAGGRVGEREGRVARERAGARAAGLDETAGLVVRAREGDGGAWARLVERYTSFLWAIARSYELNDADAADVVQTTWMRLVERIDAIEEPAATGRWLAVTARRESARTARRRGREPVAGVPPAADASAAPERIVLARERLGRVAAAIEALPRRCRALLRLYALAPSHAELAAAMEMPAGSVTSARRRCMGRLERRLAR